MTGDERSDSTILMSALASVRQPTPGADRTASLATPVILDLDGRGVQTIVRAAGGVRYDLDGDGLADLTSWIGATEGFLFLDRDGNGTVTNAGEFSFLTDLPGAVSDLQGLRAFDSSKDGALSAADARWGDFRIWQDKNGNGVAETGEILSLAAAGVKSINLTATAFAGLNAPDDVATIARGSYTRTNGTTMDLIDAALTYVSASRDGLPALSFVTQIQDRKASKYRISAVGGRMVVAPKHGGNPVDLRAGGLSGAVELHFKHATVGMLTAIVLDLDGDGISLVKSRKSRGWFDMNGDGSPDQQGWAGRRDGFLVIDRDGDGRIGNGAELSLLAEDPTAGSSLAALAKLDSDGDKIIDKSDARFAELKIWVDANGNGITDNGELKALADVDIKSISLDARPTGDRVKPGENLVMATATFAYANGMKRTLGDVALAFKPSEPSPRATVVDRSVSILVPALADSDPALPADPRTGMDPSSVDIVVSSQAVDVSESGTTPDQPIARPIIAIISSLPAVVPWIDDGPLYVSEASGRTIEPIDRATALPVPSSSFFATSSDQFVSAIVAFNPPLGTAELSNDFHSVHSNPLTAMIFSAARGS